MENDFKKDKWYQDLKFFCKAKSVRTEAIFLFFQEYLDREPTREEYDELWKGGITSYYYARKAFRKKEGSGNE